MRSFHSDMKVKRRPISLSCGWLLLLDVTSSEPQSRQSSDQQGRMLIVVTVLLLLQRAQSDESFVLVNKTVSPGEDVTLTCERSAPTNLVWIRLGLDHTLDAFGKLVSSYTKAVNIKPKFEKVTFSLVLSQVREEDSAVFICMEIVARKWTFLKRVQLTVADLSKPVHPGTSSPHPRPTPEDFTSCFPPGKFPSGPASVYTEGNHEYDCGDEREGQSSSTCVYRFFMNTSLADGGSCSVTSCGERSDRGAAVSIESTNNVLYLGAAAALTVIVFAVCLSHQPKNVVDLRAQASDGLQAHLSHEYSVMCYTAVYSDEKAGGERPACRRRSENVSH